MLYKVFFFDPREDIISENFEEDLTKEEAEKEVKKLRKSGFPAFYDEQKEEKEKNIINE